MVPARPTSGLLTFRELWQRLNGEDEGTEIEAKHGSQVGDSALETVSAFSNEPHRGGGYLIFGLRQRPDCLFPDYELIGVDSPERVVTELATRCNTEFNHPIRPRIYQERVSDKTVVVAHIAEAQPQQKPVFIKRKGQQLGTFRRIGSTDTICSDEDLAYFYQEQTHRTYDETLVPDASLDDLDPEMFQEYRRLRATVNPGAAELGYTDAELAYALNAAGRRDGRLVPTLAGILVFGTRAAVRRFLLSMRVDYIRVEGREWVPDPQNRYQAVEILDPLLRAIPRAISQILDDLPKAFHLPAGQDRRQDIPAIPRDAIREVVVNAVMHRTYRVRGAIQIIRYANRLEIRNPGVSLVPDDRLGEPGSITRNEKIAAILHETQYAETKGTGIRAIRTLMDQYGLAPPFFESDRVRDSFTAYFLFHHLLSPDDLAWLDGFRDLKLSPEEQKALVYLREIGALSNALYRAINRVDPQTAGRDLYRLRELRLLQQRGQGRGTYYVATPELQETYLDVAPGRGPAVKSDELEAKSDELGAKSDELGAKSDELGAKSDDLASDSLPPDLLVAVAQLAGKAPEARVRAALLQACAVRPMTAEELGRLTERDPRYLRHHYLRPLIKAGLIQYRFPEEPTHPLQAYTTVDTPSRKD
ncbi:MAG: ATP-binding protein [Armatimonadota bacterium]